MFRRKEKYLIRDNTRRAISIKYRYLNLLEKSLFHNRLILKKKKLIILIKRNSRILSSKKLKNLCTLSGENTAVNKKILLSRFQINYISIVNKLQNFRVNSW